MDFDEVLTQLGSFGYWQRVIFIVISVADVFGSLAMLVMMLTGATPTWSCNTYSYKDITLSVDTLPNTTDLMKCSYNDTFVCTNFTFHDDFTSVVSEWTLICNSEHVSDMITTIQMVGLIIGAACFGQLADSVGRKKAFFLGFTIMIVSGFTSAFSLAWQMFAVCRFFVGVGYGATSVVMYSYSLEFVGQQWRTLTGTLGFWAVGGMLLALSGYIFPRWNHLLMFTSASGVLYYITWLILPESPRWLILKDRVDEAEAIVLDIAKRNNIESTRVAKLKDYLIKCRNDEQEVKNYTYLDLFKTWQYCKMALILILVWFTVFIMYYGLAYNMRNMSGNRYLNIFLAGVLDLLAMQSVIPFNNIIGRRYTQLLFMLAAGVADCLIIGVIASGTQQKLANMTLACALIGKASALAGTYVVQIWTAELFPTAIRNQALGVGSVSGRIGGMLSPEIVFLGESFYLGPYIITLSLCILCVPLVFLLNETNGQHLNDAFEPKLKTSDKAEDTKL